MRKPIIVHRYGGTCGLCGFVVTAMREESRDGSLLAHALTHSVPPPVASADQNPDTESTADA